MLEPSLTKQSAWLLTAKVIGFAVSFVLPLVLVRQLAQDDFGVYRQAFTVVNTAVGILPLGLGMSAFYYLSRNEKWRASAVFNILIFYFVMGGIACLTLVAFPEILGRLFSESEMAVLSPLIGLLIWVWIFSLFLETAAVANKEPILALAFIVFAQVSKTILLITGVSFFGTVRAIIIAAIIQGLLQSIILLVYLNNRFPQFWMKFDLSFFREHMAYALPFGFAGLFWIVQTDAHLYFVGNNFSTSEYAIYIVGCSQIPLISMLHESVTSVMIPRMSELQNTNNQKEMIRLTAVAATKLSTIYLPVFVFLFITAETFIVVLFTREFTESTPIFRIFLLLIPLSVLVKDPIVRAHTDMGNFLLKLRIASIPILIAALYFAVGTNDLRMVILTVVLFTTMESLVLAVVVFRKVGMEFTDFRLFSSVGKTAVISMLAGIAAFIAYAFLKTPLRSVADQVVRSIIPEPGVNILDEAAGLLILSSVFAIFAVLYIFFIFRFGVVSNEDKDWLLDVFSRMKFGRRNA
ncbi:MAG: oligosaccharide flippase family protein [Acidobacteria bacterium]|nr:oligosaccharide flippase family protein [Acidobacteriota bacterium]